MFGDLVQTLMIFATAYVILHVAISNDDLNGFQAYGLVFCTTIWTGSFFFEFEFLKMADIFHSQLFKYTYGYVWHHCSRKFVMS